MHDTLVKALILRQREYTEALNRIKELAPSDIENEVYDIAFLLRESVELTGCLRRLVEGRTTAEIHRAFGAPGDFGYETPIGEALAAVYRSPTQE